MRYEPYARRNAQSSCVVESKRALGRASGESTARPLLSRVAARLGALAEKLDDELNASRVDCAASN